jgi:hypothetical protein
MNTLHKGALRSFIGAALLCAGLSLAPALAQVAQANDDNRAQDLQPPGCESIQVPPGNRIAFRAYAVGAQRYRWNGSGWDFVEPVATLYADANFHLKVGSHYAGPTWESVIGGKVVATRLAGCSPDTAAIPWLLLQAVSTDGHDIFSSVTYIQRVNTKGGLIPTAPGPTIGAIADVPYTAEYYFYRAKN